MASDSTRARARGPRLVGVLVGVAMVCATVRPAHATVLTTPPVEESSPEQPFESEPTDGGSFDEQPDIPDDESPPEEVTEPVTEPPPPDPSTDRIDPTTDYDAFAQGLPDDFDINYVFVPTIEEKVRKPPKVKPVKEPRERRDRYDDYDDDYDDKGPREPMSPRAKLALRISGGTIMGLGLVGGVVMLNVGGFMAAAAKKDLSSHDESTLPTPEYLQAQQASIEKGELGNTMLIAGGATAGGAFTLGLALLLAGRAKPSEAALADDYSAPPTVRQGPFLTSESRAAFVVLMIAALGGGASMLIVGGIRDIPAKKKEPLLVGGGALMGFGVLVSIPLIIDRSRSGLANVRVAPMFTRTFTGAQLSMRF